VSAAARRAAILQGFELYDDLRAIVDDRTIEIADHRRRTAVIHRRGWLMRRALLVADVVGLLAAMSLAELVVTAHAGQSLGDSRAETLVFIASLPGWVVLAKLYGLYDRDEERTDHSTADEITGVLHLVTVCAFVFAVGGRLIHVVDPLPSKIAIFWLAAVTLISVARASARSMVRRNTAYVQNTVIVGAGEVAQQVARKLLQHPEYGINLVGFVESGAGERRQVVEHVSVIGTPEKLPALIHLFDVERVIIAFSYDSQKETLELVRRLQELDIQIDVVPRLFELVGPEVSFHTVEGLPLMGLPPVRLAPSSKLLKRALDLVLSLVALVALAPAFLLIAAAIKLDTRGPVFFRQLRVGSGGRPFRIFKFRSMTADADARKNEVAHLNKHLRSDPRMFKIPGDPRVTRTGKLLRRFSLDELPQLLNVIAGDMSLVGPRPLIVEEAKCVKRWGQKRLDLKPGITGLWQVLGRSDIPFEEMVRLDYVYVTAWSLSSDLRLLLRTIPVLFGGGRVGS